MVTRCGICGKITAVTWPEFYVYKIGDCYYCSANCMAVADVKQRREKSGFVKEDSEMRGKITLEQKKKAVEIALGGGDPRDYLKACGSKNPDAHWYYIKNKLKDTDPGTYYALIGPVGTLAAKLDGFEPVSVPKSDQKPEEDLVDKALPEGEDLEKVEAVGEYPAAEEENAPQKADLLDGAGIPVAKKVEMAMKNPVTPAPEEICITATKGICMPDGMRITAVEGKHGKYKVNDGFECPVYMDVAFKDMNMCLSLAPDEWREVIKEIQDVMAVFEI